MNYDNYKLLYIETIDNPCVAKMYFTDREISECWGDDWDDAPYEHNAEPPSQQEHIVYIIEDDVGLNTPDALCLNSEFAVEDMLGKKQPWLEEPTLYAGDSLKTVLLKLKRAGVRIYKEI